MNASIQFNNVSLSYGEIADEVEVLKSISFAIDSSEVVSIVGPSGSGKTSIIMLASGLENATKGSIKINGEEIVGLKEKELSEVRRKNIGIVFQSFYLIPNLTAVENVLLSLEANQQYSKEKDAEELLGEFGLSHRMHHLPSELSGGEQQRVAIARALINKPKIILADEPTGNLDSVNSESMIDLLFDYTKKSHTSLVMVTHDNSIAQRCDRIIEIRDGQIV
ncbi:MAG: ABC transporter ATP-binding protein [Candidatus Thioglobus sp.]|nr:ABC transporter ATP-binding protein [Candidatus Thioglobus sp.]